jgi:hypothetical protein
MKDFNLSEMFCEVLGGGLAIVLAIAALDLSGCLDIVQLFKDVNTKLSLGAVTVGVIGSYLVGLLMDAIGLLLGEWWFDKVACAEDPPSDEQIKDFWTHAKEHMVNYRDHQWAFYSAYRILFLLLLPGSIILVFVVSKHAGPCWIPVPAALLIGLEVSLFFSARYLLTLYYSLTKQFSQVATKKG